MKHTGAYTTECNNKDKEKGLSIRSCLRYILSGPYHSGPVLGNTFTLFLPVFIMSACVPAPASHAEEEYVSETSIAVLNDKHTDQDSFDILTFNNDRMMRLDSYHHWDTDCSRTVRTFSSTGDKIFFAIANSHRKPYDWAEINSMKGLENLYMNLEDESRESPCMTGIAEAKAGSRISIHMKMVMAEIYLRSISCDFTGRGYEGSAIKDMKVYLTNVCSETSLIQNGRNTPRRYINVGMLNTKDMKGFKEKDMLMSDIGTMGDKTTIYPGKSLMCYPNNIEPESPGTPHTRLVIEGNIQGRKYYWPIDINSKDGEGIESGCRYLFDICIRRTGTSDPDTPIRIHESEIKLEIARWEEKQEYGVRF